MLCTLLKSDDFVNSVSKFVISVISKSVLMQFDDFSNIKCKFTQISIYEKLCATK